MMESSVSDTYLWIKGTNAKTSCIKAVLALTALEYFFASVLYFELLSLDLEIGLIGSEISKMQWLQKIVEKQ